MKKIMVLLVVVMLGLFLAGCSSSSDGYATYNQQPQGQYVGGGCGVAPQTDYEMPSFDSASQA